VHPRDRPVGTPSRRVPRLGGEIQDTALKTVSQKCIANPPTVRRGECDTINRREGKESKPIRRSHKEPSGKKEDEERGDLLTPKMGKERGGDPVGEEGFKNKKNEKEGESSSEPLGGRWDFVTYEGRPERGGRRGGRKEDIDTDWEYGHDHLGNQIHALGFQESPQSKTKNRGPEGLVG